MSARITDEWRALLCNYVAQYPRKFNVTADGHEYSFDAAVSQFDPHSMRIDATVSGIPVGAAITRYEVLDFQDGVMAVRDLDQPLIKSEPDYVASLTMRF